MLSQFDYKIFSLKRIKELYAIDVDFKDAFENFKVGRTWNKYVLNGGHRDRAESYAFRLALYVYYFFARGAWRRFNATF